jgi:hypothetical protein
MKAGTEQPPMARMNTDCCAPCIANLRVIEGAKEQWADEYSKTTNDVPTWDDMRVYCFPGTNRTKLICPGGGI